MSHKTRKHIKNVADIIWGVAKVFFGITVGVLRVLLGLKVHKATRRSYGPRPIVYQVHYH